MKIYSISGLGANHMVFDLMLNKLDLHVLNWIEPLQNEKISAYARRLAEPIDKSSPFCLLGVSYGGLMAVEMNRFLTPNYTFLISSAQNSNELRKVYRFIGKINLDKIMPEKWYKMPAFIVLPFLGARNNKELAKIILSDMSPYFTKWAVNQLLRWNSNDEVKNLIKIHGSNDLLMPLRPTPNTKIIKGGTHFMIADRADEIVEIVKTSLYS